jgi:hypothetical protein
MCGADATGKQGTLGRWWPEMPDNGSQCILKRAISTQPQKHVYFKYKVCARPCAQHIFVNSIASSALIKHQSTGRVGTLAKQGKAFWTVTDGGKLCWVLQEVFKSSS